MAFCSFNLDCDENTVVVVQVVAVRVAAKIESTECNYKDNLCSRYSLLATQFYRPWLLLVQSPRHTHTHL